MGCVSGGRCPWKGQETETPASPGETSAAAGEPGSAVQFLEGLASPLLLRLPQQSPGALGACSPQTVQKAGSLPSPGHGPSECALSHITHMRLRAHSPPTSGGLGGNACGSFSWEKQNPKLLNTGQASVSPAGDRLGEWVSGPGLALSLAPCESSQGPCPLGT